MHRKDAIAWVVWRLRFVAVSVSGQDLGYCCRFGHACRADFTGEYRAGDGRNGQAPDQTLLAICASIETADAMAGVLKRVRKKRKKKLLISCAGLG